MGLFGDLYDEAAAEELTDDELVSSSYSILASHDERYIHSDKIGSGGSKEIYSVFDTRLRHDVAMAIPLQGTVKSEYDPFIHEAWVTGQLDHPGIIKVHDAGINDVGIPYFTMDVKFGVNLNCILKDYHSKNTRNYSLDKLIDIFLRICDAISYAHSQHILHLDLKPDNIQIGEYGEVVICDWGLAKIINRDDFESLNRLDLNADILASENRSEFIKGTPGYMSPEQVSGDEVSRASDVYSLGAILYTILAGQSPVGNCDDAHVAMQKTVSGIDTLPSQCKSSLKVPKGLESIAMKALANGPNQRYESVVALRDDIYKFQNGYVTSAEPQSMSKEILFFYRRNRVVSIISLSFVILVAVIAAGFIAKLNQSWREEYIARQQAVVAKDSAEEALRMYKQEKASGVLVKNELSNELVHAHQIFNSRDFVKNPLMMLHKSLKGFQHIQQTKPTDPQAEMMVGLLLLITQYYDQAAVIINDTEALSDLRPLTALLPKFEPTANVPLVSIPIFAKIVADFTSTGVRRNAMVFRAIVYDCAKRKVFPGYEAVIEQALHVFNPHWKEINRTFKYKDNCLQLHGRGLRNLCLKDQFGEFYILKTIPIDYLDVRQTQFADLNQLAETTLNTLDIRMTRVKDLAALSSLTTLRTLIVEPGQFSKTQLKKVPSFIKVQVIAND